MMPHPMMPYLMMRCRFEGRINRTGKISVCSGNRNQPLELFGSRCWRSRCCGGRRSRGGGGGRSTAGGGRSGRGRGGRGLLRLCRRIDPAAMHAAVEGFGDLRVDLAAESRQTTERRLDVAAGAAKTVVEIEMAERGVEIVEPHQAHDAAAEPDAFGVSGRAVERLGGLDEFVGLALIVAGRVGRLGPVRGLARLFLRMSVTALGKSASASERQRKSGNKTGNGEMAQNRISKLKHPSTHKFPDLLPAVPA